MLIIEHEPFYKSKWVLNKSTDRSFSMVKSDLPPWLMDEYGCWTTVWSEIYTFKRPYEQTGYRNLYLFSLMLSLSSYKTQIQSTLVNNNTYIHMKIIVFLSIIDFWRGQSVRYGPVKIILTEDLTCPYLSYNLSESSEFLYYIWK